MSAIRSRPRLAWAQGVVCAVALGVVGCNRTALRGAGDPQLGSNILEHGGLERSYQLLIPASYEQGSPAPLVLALHGGGGSGSQMCIMEGGVQELAEAEGFLVACPDGVDGNWNDGRDIDRYRAHAEDIDDVGYLLALVDHLSATYSVDPQRVFVTGASNGGMMTLRMACEASTTFAAAAAVIASLPADLDCQPEHPISVLLMNGTEDPLMPYEGGQVRFYRQELGPIRSTAETIEFWVSANRCDPTPLSELLPDVDSSDGAQVRRETYSKCAQDVSVVLYTMVGGGHAWPGGSQYAPEFVIGRVNRDLDAGETIWEFYERSGAPANPPP